jgi:hypothetical protein
VKFVEVAAAAGALWINVDHISKVRILEKGEMVLHLTDGSDVAVEQVKQRDSIARVLRGLGG